MPPRGLENRLPTEVRERLERRLIELGFSNYDALIEELNGWIEESGAESVSRSALYRFGSKFEERVSMLKRSTEMAKTLANEIGDDSALLGDAVIRMAQSQLFDLLMQFQLDPDEESMGRITHAIASLSKASVQQKKHLLDTREQDRKKLAELERQSAGGKEKSGLDPETLRRIREEIYGLT